VRVVACDPGLELRTVLESDLDALRAVDDVAVCQDETIGGEDEPGTGPHPLPAEPAAEAASAVELGDDVHHRGAHFLDGGDDRPGVGVEEGIIGRYRLLGMADGRFYVVVGCLGCCRCHGPRVGWG